MRVVVLFPHLCGTWESERCLEPTCVSQVRFHSTRPSFLRRLHRHHFSLHFTVRVDV
jgi:hypothetical protein